MELYLGMAKSGKTTAVYQEIAQRIKDGRSNLTMLIVPEQYTLEAEKQLIQHLGAQGFIGVEVLSLKRLSYKILSETGFKMGTHVSETGKLMLLQSIFSQSKLNLKYYQNAYEKSGFLSRFLDLIKEFKQSQLTGADLLALTESSVENELLKLKLEDMATILNAYEMAKSGTYFDDEDLTQYFISELPKSHWLKAMHIFIDGFDSFSALEHQVIKALSENCKALSLTLPFQGEFEAEAEFECFRHTKNTWQRLAETIDIKEEKLFKKDFLKPSLSHVAKGMSQYPYPAYKGDFHDTFFGFSAASIASEVAYCAVQILKCVQEDGFRYDEIAVVTNALETYDTVIQRTFSQYDIPFFLDSKVGVLHQPLTHFMLALLNLPLQYKDGLGAVRMLKTGLVPCEWSLVYEMELYVKAYGVKVPQFLKPFEKEPVGNHSLEALNEVREQIANILAPLLKLSKEKEVPVKTQILELYNILESNAIYQSLFSLSKEIEVQGDYMTAKELVQVWNAYMNLFDEMVTLMGERPLAYSELVKMLQTGIEYMEVGRLPLEKNVVLVGSLDRSKSHPIKILFLLGLNEGVLPESGGAKALLLESEKNALQKNGRPVISDYQMFINKEAFNVYMTLTRPKDRVYLSYTKSDAEGKTMRPSPFVSKLTKLLPQFQFKEEVRELLDEEERPFWVYSEMPTYEKLALSVRKMMDGYPVNDKWWEVMSWFKHERPEAYTHLLTGALHKNTFEKLSKSLTEALYPTPLKSSVSALETYAQCPFKYFVKTGLTPQKEKAFKLDLPDIGSLFHSTLEAFGKTLYDEKKQWRDLDDATCDQYLEGIVEKIIDNDLYQSRFSYRYMANKLKRVSKRAVHTLRYQLSKGAFEPSAFELAFNDGMLGVPPIVISLSNQKQVYLRGVIDRVDLLTVEDKTYINIIDYKSGSKHLTLSEVYHGLQMQLLVYLKACIGQPEYFRATSLYPGGAFYFRIDDPFVDSTEKVKALVEEALNESLKLDGLCLDDVEVLKGLDASLYETGKSDVVKVKFKNTGEFTKDSKAINLEAFNALMLWVEDNVREMAESILEGDMSISPCKIGGFVSCQFCDYSALCQFDLKFENNSYRLLKVLDDEVIMEKVLSRGGKDHVDQ